MGPQRNASLERIQEQLAALKGDIALGVRDAEQVSGRMLLICELVDDLADSIKEIHALVSREVQG